MAVDFDYYEALGLTRCLVRLQHLYRRFGHHASTILHDVHGVFAGVPLNQMSRKRESSCVCCQVQRCIFAECCMQAKTCLPNRFRKLALVYHPDRNASDSAKQDFLQICEAYDILGNREYNRNCLFALSTMWRDHCTNPVSVCSTAQRCA